jgi:small multidrug resistance pump
LTTEVLMAYVFLVLAIAVEVLGTSLLRATDGFSRLWPSVACLSAYGLSFVLLAQTVKTLPVGVIYAVWSGLGTAAIVAVSATFLGESLTPPLIAGIVLIIAGVVVVNLSIAR